MWRISQSEDGWQLLADDQPCGGPHGTYELALLALAGEATKLAGAATQGLLAEQWHSPAGICFSEDTGDGRDFSSCDWTWRDPDVSLLPLMFQDKTDMGHFGAQLAGFIETIELKAGTVHASGRFYDTEVGRQARDVVTGSGRFGVSVDPAAVDAEWECLEEDDEGWCTAEIWHFGAYEIAGLTMTPFPAFARAAIEIAGGTAEQLAITEHDFKDDDEDGKCDVCLTTDDKGVCTAVCGGTEAEHQAADDSEAAVVVPLSPAASLVAPPAAWFDTPEPAMGDSRYVDQGQGRVAIPLTISDDGQVFGHLASWGQCHVGFAGTCVEPPSSASAYTHFRTGEIVCADGSRRLVGPLTMATDHAAIELRAVEALDHYAHTGLAWADVTVSDGEHGPWLAGAIRPDVTPDVLRVLRASSLSGDWRTIGRGLELIGVLAVNTPGFPIQRALAASAQVGATPRASARVREGRTTALVASGMVKRCSDCARRAAGPQQGKGASISLELAGLVREAVDHTMAAWMGEAMAKLAVIEKRTRHLRAAERDALAARIKAS